MKTPRLIFIFFVLSLISCDDDGPVLGTGARDRCDPSDRAGQVCNNGETLYTTGVSDCDGKGGREKWICNR